MVSYPSLVVFSLLTSCSVIEMSLIAIEFQSKYNIWEDSSQTIACSDIQTIKTVDVDQEFDRRYLNCQISSLSRPRWPINGSLKTDLFQFIEHTITKSFQVTLTATSIGAYDGTEHRNFKVTSYFFSLLFPVKVWPAGCDCDQSWTNAYKNVRSDLIGDSFDKVVLIFALNAYIPRIYLIFNKVIKMHQEADAFLEFFVFYFLFLMHLIKLRG